MELQRLIDNVPKHIKRKFCYKSFTKDSPIIYPGEENNYLYILTKGMAEVYWQNYSGAMISLYLYEPYSCFGENELFNENLKTLCISAKMDCEVILIDKPAVYEWMKSDFDFNLYIIEQLSDKLISSSEKTMRLSLLSVKERVLYSIFSHYNLKNLDSLTKKALAIEVMAPLRSLNRSIANFVNEGIIEYKNKIFSVKSIEKIKKCLADNIE